MYVLYHIKQKGAFKTLHKKTKFYIHCFVCVCVCVCVCAVSYTHLDVYKRQSCRGPNIGMP